MAWSAFVGQVSLNRKEHGICKYQTARLHWTEAEGLCWSSSSKCSCLYCSHAQCSSEEQNSCHRHSRTLSSFCRFSYMKVTCDQHQHLNYYTQEGQKRGKVVLHIWHNDGLAGGALQVGAIAGIFARVCLDIQIRDMQLHLGLQGHHEGLTL